MVTLLNQTFEQSGMTQDLEKAKENHKDPDILNTLICQVAGIDIEDIGPEAETGDTKMSLSQ